MKKKQVQHTFPRVFIFCGSPYFFSFRPDRLDENNVSKKRKYTLPSNTRCGILCFIYPASHFLNNLQSTKNIFYSSLETLVGEPTPLPPCKTGTHFCEIELSDFESQNEFRPSLHYSSEIIKKLVYTLLLLQVMKYYLH